MGPTSTIIGSILAIGVFTLCIIHTQSAAVVTRAEVQEEVGSKFREDLELISAKFVNLSYPLCDDIQKLLDNISNNNVTIGCDKQEPVFYNLDGLIPNVSVKGELGILRKTRFNHDSDGSKSGRSRIACYSPTQMPVSTIFQIPPKRTLGARSLTLSSDKRPSEITVASILYNGEDHPLDIEWGYAIPSLGVEMVYELRDVIALGFVPISGKGVLRVSLDGLEVTQKGQLPLVDPLTLKPETFNIDIYNHKIKLRIQGLFDGNEELAQTVSDALSSLLFSKLNSEINKNLNIILNSALGQSLLPPVLDEVFFKMALGWTTVAEVRDVIGKPAP